MRRKYVTETAPASEHLFSHPAYTTAEETDPDPHSHLIVKRQSDLKYPAPKDIQNRYKWHLGCLKACKNTSKSRDLCFQICLLTPLSTSSPRLSNASRKTSPPCLRRLRKPLNPLRKWPPF